MTQRFEGRNLEEALTSAASALGAERWQIKYHVLLEKRGFLGGMKRVVIEADLNDSATPPAVVQPPAATSVAPVVVTAAPTPRVEAPRPAAPAPRQESHAPRPSESGRSRGRSRGGSRSGGGERGHGGERGRGGERGGERGRGRGDRGPRREQSSDRYERKTPPPPEQAQESAEALTVRAWVETIIDLAHLDLVLRTEENETQIHVRLYGPDTDKVVDQHGELLDAIQVLANKALVGRKVTKEIELDADAFKERRLDELEERALELAAKVRIDGREQLLPPMSPIERRIIHVALQDDEEVTTVSRGEGFFKRVAVLMKSDAESEKSAAPPPAQEP